jgi:hypothetical protein
LSKHYTLLYPDHSKGNINAREKESLLLAGDIEKIDERTYKLIGAVILLHSFHELGRIRPRILVILTRFFPGMFVREFEGKRIPELLESPEAMALRLRLTNAQV